MKATAKCNVNIGGVWYAKGDVFDVADTNGLAEYCEFETAMIEEPEKPKRGRKKKTEE